MGEKEQCTTLLKSVLTEHIIVFFFFMGKACVANSTKRKLALKYAIIVHSRYYLLLHY